MTWIKICGTTNLEDAQVAVEAGADALGFVFYEKSPRNVDPEKAAEIIAAVPRSVEKVGVFVDQPVTYIQRTVELAGITAAQLCLEPRKNGLLDLCRLTELCPGLKLTLAFPVPRLLEEGLFTFDEASKKMLHAIMFDSGTAVTRGGTGRTFDWQQAQSLIQTFSTMLPVIVAGGLSPQNVGQAIKLFHPFGVDVVSGVEARPGKKDPEKVRAFVSAVRNADRVT